MLKFFTHLQARIRLLTLQKGSPLVLAYHNIENCSRVGHDLYTVTTRNFSEHMSVIRKHFTAIKPDELFNTGIESKPRVLITFDDGRKNNYTQAFPILSQFGLPALFFITSDFIGTEGFMTEQEINFVSRNNISIGSHSFTHPDFGKISTKQTKKELEKSKNTLEKIVLNEITTFAYPFGNAANMKENDKEVLCNLGYKQAYRFGGNGLPGKEDNFRIPRYMVTDVLGNTFFNQIITAMEN